MNDINPTHVVLFGVSIVAFAVIGALIFNYVVDLGVEGDVTDKYILSGVSGNPVYYLVIDNEKDIRVNEETYYDFNVGDWFEGNAFP